MYQVIVVEDDPMVAQINCQYLRRFSNLHVLEVFHNGKDALNYLKENSVDLVIVDITMPVMNDLELVRKMRRNKINSDVIVVTAANDIDHLEEMFWYGVIDYLVKPFDRERFEKALHKFLDKAKLLSNSRPLKQEEIDQLIHTANQKPQSSEIKKGIQPATLVRIKEYLNESTLKNHDCETLATALNLSRVTVRRYLNYLVETGFLVNTINYETGGRPSMIYSLNDDHQ